MYSPSAAVPASRCGREGRRGEAGGRRVCIGIEGRFSVAGVARPPAHGNLLGVHGVAHDEIVGGWVGRQAGEQIRGQVERSPPGVDRCRPSTVGRTERRQHERRLRGGRKVGLDLLGHVAGVELVLVQRHGPCNLLWLQVDVEGAHVAANGLQDLPCHFSDRPVRREPDARRAPVAVLDDRGMGAKVECDRQDPRTVGCRQGSGLPSPRRQSECRVLELRFGWCQRNGQLPQELRVGVQGVARLVPILVRDPGPVVRHIRRLSGYVPLDPARPTRRVSGTGHGREWGPSQASRERTSAASSTERAAASAPIRDGSGDMVLMMMSVKPSAPIDRQLFRDTVRIAVGHRPAIEPPVATGDRGRRRPSPPRPGLRR